MTLAQGLIQLGTSQDCKTLCLTILPLGFSASQSPIFHAFSSCVSHGNAQAPWGLDVSHTYRRVRALGRKLVGFRYVIFTISPWPCLETHEARCVQLCWARDAPGCAVIMSAVSANLTLNHRGAC